MKFSGCQVSKCNEYIVKCEPYDGDTDETSEEDIDATACDGYEELQRPLMAVMEEMEEEQIGSHSVHAVRVQPRSNWAGVQVIVGWLETRKVLEIGLDHISVDELGCIDYSLWSTSVALQKQMLSFAFASDPFEFNVLLDYVSDQGLNPHEVYRALLDLVLGGLVNYHV